MEKLQALLKEDITWIHAEKAFKCFTCKKERPAGSPISVVFENEAFPDDEIDCESCEVLLKRQWVLAGWADRLGDLDCFPCDYTIEWWQERMASVPVDVHDQIFWVIQRDKFLSWLRRQNIVQEEEREVSQDTIQRADKIREGLPEVPSPPTRPSMEWRIAVEVLRTFGGFHMLNQWAKELL